MKSLFFKQNTYSLKWQLVFNTDYKISECKKIINTKNRTCNQRNCGGLYLRILDRSKIYSQKKDKRFC